MKLLRKMFRNGAKVVRILFMNSGVKTYIRVFHYQDGDPGYGKGSLEFVTHTPNESYYYDVFNLTQRTAGIRANIAA